MRLNSFLLPALVAASSLPLEFEKRQFGNFGILKLASSTDLKPEVNPKAIRKLNKLGPFKLKAAAATATDSGEQNFAHLVREGFCKDCTVLKGHVGIVNVDGTPANPETGVYIHHIITSDITKKTKKLINSCSSLGGIFDASSMGGAKFIGTGEDNNNQEVWYTAEDGSSPSGFHIGASDSFFMNTDLVNLAKTPKEVYITVDLEYLQGKQGADAQEKLLSVTGCGVPKINLSETGPVNTTSAAYSFAEDGYILLAKGHLHAGGLRMILNINGKFTCQSVASYTEGVSAISSMSICSKTPIPFKKGDKFTMTVEYDISKHKVRDAAGGHSHKRDSMPGMDHSSGGSSSMPDIMAMFDFVLTPKVA